MIKMHKLDLKSKRFQEIRGLDVATNSLDQVQKNVPAHIISEQTKKAVEAIIICAKMHKEDPCFPAEEVRSLANNLRTAIEERNPSKTILFRKKAREIISPWINKRAAIIVGS